LLQLHVDHFYDPKETLNTLSSLKLEMHTCIIPGVPPGSTVTAHFK